MGRILLFKDVIRSLRIKPEKGYILLGERDDVGDEQSRNVYDLVFHIADGPNVANYQERVSLVIPVMASSDSEREALESIAAIYSVYPANEVFCVNCFTPRFYRVVGESGQAMEINEEKVKVIDREAFYELASDGKRFEIERKIVELEKQV